VPAAAVGAPRLVSQAVISGILSPHTSSSHNRQLSSSRTKRSQHHSTPCDNDKQTPLWPFSLLHGSSGISKALARRRTKPAVVHGHSTEGTTSSAYAWHLLPAGDVSSTSSTRWHFQSRPERGGVDAADTAEPKQPPSSSRSASTDAFGGADSSSSSGSGGTDSSHVRQLLQDSSPVCPEGCTRNGCVQAATPGGLRCNRCKNNMLVNKVDGTCCECEVDGDGFGLVFVAEHVNFSKRVVLIV